MKKLNTYLIAAFAIAGLGLSSCQKDFDPKSYAPPLDISGYTAASQVAPDALVAHWTFSDNLIDSVSNTAGVATGTSFTAGLKGSGLQGALNSYVLADPSDAVKNLKNVTLTEWINTPPPSTGVIGIFSLAKTNGFWGNLEIFIENGSTNENGKLRIHFYGAGDDRTFAVDNVQNLFGKWVNVGVSYNGTECKLYVNGSKIATQKVANLSGDLAFANVGKLVFGCVQFQTTPSQTSSTGKQDWASYLTGSLDEIRIYNKALTDTEVNAVVKLEGRGK